MKIVVGIPSLNEEDSIRHVVRMVDEGLLHYCPGDDHHIVNVDSSSTDHTVSTFLGTETQATKHSIVTEPPLGKGSNIFGVINAALTMEADVVAMLDADVTSIEPQWIHALTGPIVLGKADFVAPSYLRNRYEASTTNHFAFPFVFCRFGQYVRQPIGGEFAFGRRFAEYILSKATVPETQRYGIDIHLTVHAIGGGFAVGEAWLGRKIHKPSFSKMSDMFPEVVQAALHAAKEYRQSEAFAAPTSNVQRPLGIDSDYSFPHASKVGALLDDALERYLKLRQDWPTALGAVYGSDSLEPRFLKSCSAEEWVEILSRTIKYGLDDTCDLSFDNMGTLLYPMFVRRLCSFWADIQEKSAQEIEMELFLQAEMLFVKCQNT